MASLLAVLEDLRVSSRYRNRRAFQKISDERMIARPDRAILQLLTGRKV